MENTNTVRMLLDTLMDNKKLKMWTVYMEASGSTLMKIRFVDIQSGPLQHEQVTKQNSNIHFKRKSDSQLKRDKSRAMRHRSHVRPDSAVATRSMGKSEENDSASDTMEMPRFGLVDSAMSGENLFHMPNTHDTSIQSSSYSSDPMVPTEPEQSPGLDPRYQSPDTLPEPSFHNEQINTTAPDSLRGRLRIVVKILTF